MRPSHENLRRSAGEISPPFPFGLLGTRSCAALACVSCVLAMDAANCNDTSSRFDGVKNTERREGYVEATNGPVRCIHCHEGGQASWLRTQTRATDKIKGKDRPFVPWRMRLRVVHRPSLGAGTKPNRPLKMRHTHIFFHSLCSLSRLQSPDPSRRQWRKYRFPCKI